MTQRNVNYRIFALQKNQDIKAQYLLQTGLTSFQAIDGMVSTGTGCLHLYYISKLFSKESAECFVDNFFSLQIKWFWEETLWEDGRQKSCSGGSL